MAFFGRTHDGVAEVDSPGLLNVDVAVACGCVCGCGCVCD